MNPKINKLKAEREKNSKKIAALQQRNREIDDSIHELENLDIVGMVRSCGMTPEQLAVLIRASKGATLPPLPAQLSAAGARSRPSGRYLFRKDRQTLQHGFAFRGRRRSLVVSV